MQQCDRNLCQHHFEGDRNRIIALYNEIASLYKLLPIRAPVYSYAESYIEFCLMPRLVNHPLKQNLCKLLARIWEEGSKTVHQACTCFITFVQARAVPLHSGQT